jgi:hypothetical protein
LDKFEAGEGARFRRPFCVLGLSRPRLRDILSGMGEPLTAIEEAERAGFDLSLLKESLNYSYEQRAVNHQRALDLALEMERAGRQLRERSQSTPSASV